MYLHIVQYRLYGVRISYDEHCTCHEINVFCSRIFYHLKETSWIQAILIILIFKATPLYTF